MPESASSESTTGPPITHVNVLPFGDQLFVTWRGGGEGISVFVSDDPDDAGVRVWAPDRPGGAIVPRHETGRSFVHLFDPAHGFRVAAERHLVMEGPDNFRDLGGYTGDGGRRLRWGRVFRSDRLDSTTSVDRHRLLSMGISTVFDLRSDAEVAEAADQLPPDVSQVCLPMSSDGAQARSMLERITSGDLVSFGPDEMTAGYLRMLSDFPGHVTRIVETIAAGETVLFHCTAGKDRTGIIAMVLLSMCGVADADVLDDYELTNSYTTIGMKDFAAVLADHVIEPEKFATLWLAPRAVMRATLDGLRERWGDIDGYGRFVGIGDATASAFRREMLCDPM